jgi:LPS sulfotransferase NodH
MAGLFHRWRHPRRCYLICGIARSGSNLLSDGLRETGRAGRPNQFFLPGFEDYFRNRHQLAADIPFADYLEKMIEGTATSNEVFGFKLMGWYLQDFLARLRGTAAFGNTGASDLEILRTAFPRLRFIQITRRAKLRQAISKARAIQTGLWKALPGRTGSEQVEFDRDLITHCLKEAEDEENTWSGFFGQIGLEPFRVEYEELCQHYEPTIRAVLDYLQIRWPRGKTIQPVTVRQADAVSADWEQRYLAPTAPAASARST